MKHIFRIIIIVVLIVTFPVWKGKVVSTYNQVKSYLIGTAKQFETNSHNNTLATENISSIDKISEGNNTNSIDTPGALRVVDSILNFQNTRLSIKGIILETNKQRALQGLPPLVENTKLDKSGLVKVNDMFDYQYFEHISPTGVGVADLATDVGYEYIIIGENLALGGFKDDQAVVDAWMASPGHRANILNDRYTEIGVSVGRGIFEGREVWLAVQHFGLPKSACPSISSNLKSSIDSMQSKAKSIQKDLDKMKADIDTATDPSIKSELIKKYNDLVNTYNTLIASVKASVDKYNTQVRAFNACVKG